MKDNKWLSQMEAPQQVVSALLILHGSGKGKKAPSHSAKRPAPKAGRGRRLAEGYFLSTGCSPLASASRSSPTVRVLAMASFSGMSVISVPRRTTRRPNFP